MMTAQCVSRDQLQQYLSGWAAPEQSEVIEAHLQECSACEQAVAELEGGSDAFLESVRRSQTQPQEPETPSAKIELAAALDWAKQAPELAEASEEAQRANVEWPLASGDVGSYELLRPIGHGGMGSVYLARHRQLGKQLAIKLLSTRLNRNGDYTARFQREMRAAGGLDHAAIVRATDAGEHNGTHYLAMEYIEGLDLSRVAHLLGKFSIADACEIARQVALGLSHAHAAGITHRDIKPSNIMLSTAGQVKILDFGLARLNLWDEVSAELTTVGQLIGTLDYMAPEQADRPESVDYRADLYALGATLFRLLCGRAPLAASPEMSPLAKLRLLATHQPPSLATLRPDAPEALVQLVASLLARDPDSRPASAAHVAEELQTFAQGADLPALVARAQARAEKEPDESSAVRSNQLLPETRTIKLSENRVAAGAAKPPRRNRRVLAWAVAPLAILAGVLITLETQKGSLVIESEAANVSVKLLRDGKSYEELKIEPGTTSTRLFAGQYEVTIEGGSDALVVDKERIEIRRGEVAIARIRQQPAQRAAVAAERVDEPVYNGKPLSYWLDTIGREKSAAGYQEALAAVSAMLTSENGQQITQALLPMLRSQPAKRLINDEINLEINTFSLLRAANPGTAYYELLAKELESGPHDWQSRILLSLFLLPKDDIPTTAPLVQWLEKNVFSSGGRAEFLTQSADYYMALIDTTGPVNDQAKKHLAEVLLKCEALDDAFWLSNPTSDGGKPTSGPQFSNAPADRRPFKSWYPPIADRIEQVAIQTLGNKEADRTLSIQAAIVLRTLNSSRYDRSGMRESRDELVEAMRTALKLWQSEPARMYDEAPVPPSFAIYVWVPSRYPILSPHLTEPTKSVNVLHNLPQRDALAFTAIELLRLVSESSAGAALSSELVWVFDATDKQNAEVYGQVGSPLQLAWPQLQPPWQVNREDQATVPREHWLATFLHSFSYQTLPAEKQSELRVTAARKYQSLVFDARLKGHDSNGDGQLSIEEAKGMMRDPQRIDANGDQQLSREEFVEYQTERALTASDAELDRVRPEWDIVFGKVDKNRDGELSLDELPNKTVKPDGLDINGDGKITIEEYAILRRAGQPAPPPATGSAAPSSAAEQPPAPRESSSESPKPTPPVANAATSKTAEPLYKGQPLSHWLDTIGREKSTEGYEEALYALRAMLTTENAAQISATLRQVLREQTDRRPSPKEDDRNRNAFTILRLANPGKAFYELLALELESGSDAWHARLLDSLTLLPPEDAETIAPLTQWLEKKVFAKDGRAELLAESTDYFLYLIHHAEGVNAEAKKHFADVLVGCEALGDAHWLSKPIYDDYRPSSGPRSTSSRPTEPFKTWHPVIAEHIERVAIPTISDEQADRRLVAQALIILRTLHSSRYHRAGLRDSRAELVDALRTIMKRWQAKPAELFEAQQVDASFREYQLLMREITIISPSFESVRTRSLVFDTSRKTVNVSLEALALVEAIGAGEELTAELKWVYETTSDRNAKVYQSPGFSTLSLMWPDLDVRDLNARSGQAPVRAPAANGENLPDLTREDWLAVLLHVNAYKLLPQETQTELKAAGYRKHISPLVAEEIRRHDTDDDGLLSFEEAKPLGWDLQAIDTSGDQRISAEELVEYRTQQFVKPPLPKELEATLKWAQRTIEKYDSNRDGSLTEDEWSRMLIKPDPATDLDHNGRITAEEYARYRARRR